MLTIVILHSEIRDISVLPDYVVSFFKFPLGSPCHFTPFSFAYHVPNLVM